VENLSFFLFNGGVGIFPMVGHSGKCWAFWFFREAGFLNSQNGRLSLSRENAFPCFDRIVRALP
jgi:hypothetical protein